METFGDTLRQRETASKPRAPPLPDEPFTNDALEGHVWSHYGEEVVQYQRGWRKPLPPKTWSEWISRKVYFIYFQWIMHSGLYAMEPYERLACNITAFLLLTLMITAAVMYLPAHIAMLGRSLVALYALLLPHGLFFDADVAATTAAAATS